MPLTVLVRAPNLPETRLGFDGTQPVVVGRGASCDVRLPDASVSFRHAVLRAQGQDFVLVDEGSTNGTWVGGVRVAPRTSRIVRTGDLVRVGRMWLELRVDHGPVTRDVAGATKDLALALVSEALAEAGTDQTMSVQVVEGRDLGSVLPLAEEGREYVVGRGPECALPLADADASREHARVARIGTAVVVRDLGTKNGTWLGDARVPSDRAVPWRPAQLLRIGQTVLALREPVSDALARIESAPDEPLADGDIGEPPPGSGVPAASSPGAAGASTGAARASPGAARPSTPGAHDAASAAPVAAVPTSP
jgi:pSer/pThr/pTyr-binding forkhead associated (FHA) protein